MSPQASPNSFLEFWQDFLRQSSSFWSQAATAPQPPDPSQAWQQFVAMWTEFWTKAFTLSPDTIQTSQKLWMEQLETISQGFTKVMGTDIFATMQGKFFEQQLRWQDYLTKTRSEEHTSELQSPCNLVCRLLLEKKKLMTILNTLADDHCNSQSSRRTREASRNCQLLEDALLSL